MKKVPWRISHCTNCVPMPRFATRLANMRRCSSGSRPWRSLDRMCRKNQARISTPTATKSQTGETPPSGMITAPPTEKSFLALNQPYCDDCRMPSTTKNSPAADSTAPPRSKRGAVWVTGGSSILRARNTIHATTSTCSPNEARQLIALVRRPPISGPAAAPRPPAPLTMPKYLALVFRSGKATVTRM